MQRLQKNPTTPDYFSSLSSAASFVDSTDGSFLPVLPVLTDVLFHGTAVLLATVRASKSSLLPKFDNPTALSVRERESLFRELR